MTSSAATSVFSFLSALFWQAGPGSDLGTRHPLPPIEITGSPAIWLAPDRLPVCLQLPRSAPLCHNFLLNKYVHAGLGNGFLTAPLFAIHFPSLQLPYPSSSIPSSHGDLQHLLVSSLHKTPGGLIHNPKPGGRTGPDGTSNNPSRPGQRHTQHHGLH